MIVICFLIGERVRVTRETVGSRFAAVVERESFFEVLALRLAGRARIEVFAADLRHYVWRDDRRPISKRSPFDDEDVPAGF